jgi:hypothetical protein
VQSGNLGQSKMSYYSRQSSPYSQNKFTDARPFFPASASGVYDEEFSRHDTSAFGGSASPVKKDPVGKSSDERRKLKAELKQEVDQLRNTIH